MSVEGLLAASITVGEGRRLFPRTTPDGMTF